MAPRDPCLLEFISSCSFPPHWITASLCKYSASDSACLPRPSHKCHRSLYFNFLTYLLWEKSASMPRNHGSSLWRGTHGEALSPPANSQCKFASHVSAFHLPSRSWGPAKPWDGRRRGWHLMATMWETQIQNCPAKPNSGPIETAEIINLYFRFKPLIVIHQ